MTDPRRRRGRILPFRRRKVLSRRRPSPFRLVRPLLAALLLVGGPLALAAWVFTSPRFALAEVVVEGTRRVPEGWVREVVEAHRGRNLLEISLPVVESRLRRHPWVAGAELRKELPHRLRVVLVERVPAALLARGEDLYYVDAQGRLIAPLEEPVEEPRTGPPLLRVRMVREEPEGIQQALAVARELAEHWPEWRANLSEMEVLGETDFRLHIGGLPFPVLVSPGEIRRKAPYLEPVLAEILRRYQTVHKVDLRFSRRIVVEPAAGAGGGPGSAA